jgi:hypothetical protein
MVIARAFPWSYPDSACGHTARSSRFDRPGGGYEGATPSSALVPERLAFVAGILWTIIVILFVFWLLGLIVHVGGGLIHILIVVAVILLIFNLISGRGARV